jgi:hypothetical protein
VTAIWSGILLPESFLQSEFFQILSVFVAINTLIYVTLAVAKMLPRIHPGDLFHRRDRRSESREINPGGDEAIDA